MRVITILSCILLSSAAHAQLIQPLSNQNPWIVPGGGQQQAGNSFEQCTGIKPPPMQNCVAVCDGGAWRYACR